MVNLVFQFDGFEKFADVHLEDFGNFHQMFNVKSLVLNTYFCFAIKASRSMPDSKSHIHLRLASFFSNTLDVGSYL